jgi:apolipoprotein N-acyltransferase
VNTSRRFLWIGLALSALSGVLLTLSMPGFDAPLLGWVALTPLLVILFVAPPRQVFALTLPFGIIFSIGVHNWYPYIFPPALGYFLIVAVGFFYAGLLQLGIWLTSRLPGALKLLALPVAWSAIEFLKYIAPVVEDWWFVLLASSQWRFPPALQILGLTGFPGLSFLVLLVNVAVAALIIGGLKMGGAVGRAPAVRASVIALACVALILGVSALSIPQPANGFKVAVLTDMVNQDPLVLAQGEFAGTRVDDPLVSQRIFDTDAGLTRQVASQQPAFVVWPENEFTDTDDAAMIGQLSTLARETNAYIATDTLWHAPTGLHDTALLIAPDGKEVKRRAKINITTGEEDAGIVPGPREFSIAATPYGNVGIAVCWDVHRLWIIRELARAGAAIILLPMDNDFNGTPHFPPFHAADAVFRAVENRLAFGLGTVNGLSLVIDPYGRITAEGQINQRGVVVGDTFALPGRTFYSRFGDVFGWLLVGALAVLVIRSWQRARDNQAYEVT